MCDKEKIDRKLMGFVYNLTVKNIVGPDIKYLSASSWYEMHNELVKYFCVNINTKCPHLARYYLGLICISRR